MSFNKRNKGINPLFGSGPRTQVQKHFIRDLNLAGSLDVAINAAVSGSVYVSTGSAAEPSIGFIEQRSGLYLDLDNQRMGFVYDAEAMWVIDRFGNWSSLSNGKIRAGAGSVSFPGYSFTDDVQTGILSPAAGEVQFTSEGSSTVRIDGSGGVYAPKVLLTPEGGVAVKLTNKTSVASVKGTLVDASTTNDDAFEILGADEDHPIGVVYTAGVADGDECWVVISGVAEVLLEDTTAATRGYWARTSINDAGRADITNAAAPGGGIPELDTHMKEIGHCIQSASAGTDVLARIILHFN